MKKTLIIAEAGVNHNGSLKLAKKMIEIAAKAKCDFVKFQTFNPDELVHKKAKMAYYQKNNLKKKLTQNQMLKKYQLSKKDHVELIKICKKNNIKFLSTAFDIKSLKLLLDLRISTFKIPSGEITNYPYLEFIGKQNKKIFMSTGMSNMDEVKNAFKILTKTGTNKKNITILHCNTEYPTPLKDVNLRAMLAIKKELNVDVGYSDHSLGITVPIAAVALGAKVIEKHFTLNQKMSGPDHKASLNADNLAILVKAIRDTETLLGSKEKKISPSEKKNVKLVRKSIYVKREILVNQTIKDDDLQILRPEGGISPKHWKKIIGKKSKKKYNPGDRFYG